IEIVAAVAAVQVGFELAQKGVKIVGRLPQVARQRHQLGTSEAASGTGQQTEGPRDEAAAELVREAIEDLLEERRQGIAGAREPGDQRVQVLERAITAQLFQGDSQEERVLG